MRTILRSLSWAAVLSALAACSDAVPQPLDYTEDPTSVRGRDAASATPTPDAGSTGPDLGTGALVACGPIQAEAEPQRSGMATKSETLVRAVDVYENFFKPECGRCHSETDENVLYVRSPQELAAKLDGMDGVIERMTTTDKSKVMPPTKKLLSERGDDRVQALAELLKAWSAAGKQDLFPDPRVKDDGAVTSLAATPALANVLTNLGSCVPDKSILRTDAERMRTFDEKFEKLTHIRELPEKLSDTDLYTLDSEVLAKSGVISFAPAYTLWADDAKKMRYVRVPLGKSIAFSVARQAFEIPDNTRFYKTFLKEVRRADGSVFYRKMETRLIVVRHSEAGEHASAEIKALYGTYAWNEDESEAFLEKTPLANGQPFADQLFTYLTDEAKAQPILDAQEGASLAEKRERGEQELLLARAARHYAIPGAERCVQCHMGAPDGSFILGFTPVQIHRRELGTGGVIEAAAPSELDQMKRLIDYGVVTGLTVDQLSTKLLPLEKTQGARSPRTNAELVAQGYMLGNCAHCHNPRGFATQNAPELRDLLNFYPSADGGGVFEFPLARVSPRIQRKVIVEPGVLTIEMPYITPAILDHPLGQQFAEEAVVQPGSLNDRYRVAAPWRSLIYHNVETPFPYSIYDEKVIYPHMPMNTPGFDCRAPKIMAEWMIGLPAASKTGVEIEVDTASQPYEEVKHGDARYAGALVEAELRMFRYKSGSRAEYCPDTRDIVDGRVRPGKLPDPGLYGIPTRPHFIVTDLTDPIGDGWVPRNVSWKSILVDGKVGVPGSSVAQNPFAKHDIETLVGMLPQVRLSEEFRALARKPVPFGIWLRKPSCDFSSVPRVDSVSADARPAWFDAEGSGATDDAPLYLQSPGGAVFGMICVNCHGKSADSRGRQADSLLQLTGGGTRVANFRDGMFGPVTTPGTHLVTEFEKAGASANATPEDWAARYMAYMALGGTNATIPPAVLSVVGANPVLGAIVNRGGETSPNMLSAARAVCSTLLPAINFTNLGSEVHYGEFAFHEGEKVLPAPKNVVTKNGDYELWYELCTYDNPLPVRVFEFRPTVPDKPVQKLVLSRLYQRAGYPADAPVMDHRGLIENGVTPSNQAPWCLAPLASTENEDTRAQYERYRRDFGVGGQLVPVCPEPLLELDFGRGGEEEIEGVTRGIPTLGKYQLSALDQRNWALRGAINAGFAVFTYVSDLTKGLVKPPLDYDRCEQLGTQK